jgi:hypothetical protein
MTNDLEQPTIWLDLFLPINQDPVQQYSLIVPQILSNKIGAITPVYIRTSGTPTVVRVDLLQASIGNNVIININMGGTLWATITITAGTTYTILTSMQIAALPALVIGEQFTLDITQVGGTFPGYGLVATIVC